MTAKATPAPELRFIPLDQLHDSPTQTRDEYDPEYIAELGADIKSHGRNLSAMLVRPNPKGEGFEIVFGHCRKRGCAWAGLPAGWCEVRAMSDLEVERAQISENLHRKNIKPLAEARGFQRLMREHKITVPQLQKDFGKSRSYIYGRLSLLKLCEPVQQALANGLPVETAQRIASFENHTVQAQALARCRTTTGEWMSSREADKVLNAAFTIPISSAPFDLKDEKLHKPAGACSECPNLAANNPELADLPADTCIDKDCYELKLQAHWFHVVMQLQDEGHTVFHGEEAEDFKPGSLVPLSSSYYFNSRPYVVADMLKAKPEDMPPILLTYVAPDDSEPKGYIDQDSLNALMEALGLRKPAGVVATPLTAAAPADSGGDDDDTDGDDGEERKPTERMDPTTGWSDAELAAADHHTLYAVRVEVIRRMVDMPRTLDELRAMAMRECSMADGDMGLICEALLGKDEWDEEEMEAWIAEASANQLGALLAGLAVDYALVRAVNLYHPDARSRIQQRLATIQAYGVNVLDFVKKEEPEAPAEPPTVAPLPHPKGSKNPPVRYRNPATGETWSGRGLQPKWLKAAIAAGNKLTDYAVEAVAA